MRPETKDGAWETWETVNRQLWFSLLLNCLTGCLHLHHEHDVLYTVNNILQGSFYAWRAWLIQLRSYIGPNKLTWCGLSWWIIRSGAIALIFNSHTRFIIKGRMLEIAQMPSLYLWHSSFYGRWWGMLAESTGIDWGDWKGGTLSVLLLYINLGHWMKMRWHDFYMSDVTTALRWRLKYFRLGEWGRGQKNGGGIENCA